MFISRRKRREQQQQRQELQSQLDDARQERRDIVQTGDAAKPLLKQLQKHLQENNFAERLIQSIDASRRRTT
jgi:hypothetical protein